MMRVSPQGAADRHSADGLIDLHRFLEFLGNPEGDLLARLDLDGFASRRIPSHSGGTLPRMPIPFSRILSPFLRCRVVSVTKSPNTASACFLGRSWLSDKDGGQMLRSDFPSGRNYPHRRLFRHVITVCQRGAQLLGHSRERPSSLR